MAWPVSDLVGAPAGCLAHRSGPRKARTKEHQMTSNADATTRIIGSLRSADGKGVVRMEDRLGRSPATPKRAGSSWYLPIRTWPPASARATAGRACYGV